MKNRMGVWLLLAASSLPVWAQPTLVREVEGVSEYKLDNGLQILLVPDNAKPVMLVNMTYRVGSRHENYGETGMAHLLEHLIFKGSPRHPTPWQEFTRRGLQANGTTSVDRTNYFASFAANDDTLRWYLAWQADAMVNSHIAKADLDSEMTVVRNEMERGENNPGRVLNQAMMQAMYGWHNYGKSTIGAPSDVENVDIGRLKAFYQSYYRPDNATLIVSGKFEPQKVLGWLDDSFGKLAKPKQAMPRLYTLEPVQEGERSLSVRRVGGTPQLMLGYHIPPAATKDFAALSLLTLILGDVPGGRLYKALVAERQLATMVASAVRPMRDPGVGMVFAMPGEGVDMTILQRELIAIAEGFTDKPVTAAEVERARTVWINGWEKAFSSPEAVGNGLSEAVSAGDWRLYFLLRDRIKAASAADIQAAVTRYFRSGNRTVAQYLPTDTPQRIPAPAFADIDRELQDFKPQAGSKKVAAFESTTSNIDARTIKGKLGQGLQYALLPKPTRGEVVTGILTLDMGSENSLQGQVQVAAVLLGMLGQGSRQHSRQQWQDAADAAKLSWRTSGDSRRISIRFSTVRGQLAPALALLTEALRQPRLDAAGLEEVRTRGLNGLQAERGEPGALASNAVLRAANVYPRGHVFYTRTPEEREADLRAVTLAQVQDFHRRFYGTQSARFTLVGDFDAATVTPQLQTLLADWQAAEPFQRFYFQSAYKPGSRLQIATPDKASATVQALLEVPIGSEHADGPALLVATHILGGGADSRLWQRIREQDGLSYGVSLLADLDDEQQTGELWLSASFAPQNLAKLENALQEEWQRALRDGFTAAELAISKEVISKDMAMSLAQDGSLASTLSSHLRMGRDMRYAEQRLAAYQALTLAQVNAALRRYLQPERFIRAFAGDFK